MMPRSALYKPTYHKCLFEKALSRFFGDALSGTFHEEVRCLLLWQMTSVIVLLGGKSGFNKFLTLLVVTTGRQIFAVVFPFFACVGKAFI